jgi:hypothetical protein
MATPRTGFPGRTRGCRWLSRLLAAGGGLMVVAWVALLLSGRSTPVWGFVPGLVSVAAAVAVRPRSSIRSDACPWCGYDTLALQHPGSGCPECGAPIPARQSGELAARVREVRRAIPH